MPNIALQQRQRLFRDGLGQLLGQEDDIDVVGAVATTEELVALCTERQPAVAIIEADGVGEAVRTMAALRRRSLHTVPLRVIGLASIPVRTDEFAQLRRGGLNAFVCWAEGKEAVLRAIRNEASGCQPMRATDRAPAPAGERPVLTSRELAVLSLVSGGLTSKEVSAKLRISHKTVENHKQRIFGKLGVQSQAHAVSVAIRSGLIGAERVLQLTAPD